MKRNRMKAVRLFEHAIRLLPAPVANSSSRTSGKSELGLRNYKRRLRKLAADDPGKVFWPTLQKAILKLIKCFRDRCK
jgi:hypothetical protein